MKTTHSTYVALLLLLLGSMTAYGQTPARKSSETKNQEVPDLGVISIPAYPSNISLVTMTTYQRELKALQQINPSNL